MDAAEISRRFTNVPPKTAGTGELLDLVTAKLIELGEWIIEATPPGREQSLAITELENVSYWTKKSIALNQQG